MIHFVLLAAKIHFAIRIIFPILCVIYLYLLISDLMEKRKLSDRMKRVRKILLWSIALIWMIMAAIEIACRLNVYQSYVNLTTTLLVTSLFLVEFKEK